MLTVNSLMKYFCFFQKIFITRPLIYIWLSKNDEYFFCYVKDELFKKFEIEVDVFESIKILIRFAFNKPLITYPFFHELINLFASHWKKKINLCTDCKMIYLCLNHSLKWKSDHIFF